MKTYKQFMKIFEQQESIISLSEVEKVIKNIFNDTKVSSASTVYEKDKETGELKLIITINNLFYERTDVLHIKFIFLRITRTTKTPNTGPQSTFFVDCSIIINFFL